MTSPVGVNLPSTQVILAEAAWLRANPHFEERPATIREFVTSRYLNIESDVRVGVMQALIEIFGDKIDPHWISVKRRAVMTGAIGIGKTVFASIVLPYMVHWVSCLKDPQGYFGLMAGSRIAFMMMSTSANQALEVVFSDVKARIENSPWFMRRCKPDDKYKNSIRFPKSIWVIPGGSEETRFEGYNILGGIIDEGDSHKKTGKKDYAEQGFDTINSRIESRFMDSVSGKYKGILIVIGQMKSATGFMAGIYKDFLADEDAGAIRMAIWESLGWHNYTDNPDDVKNFRETAPRRSFIYDVSRKQIILKQEAIDLGLDYKSPAADGKLIEVPSAYIKGFQRNPQKALRDLAGIPPESSDPFIALSWRITQCQDMWHERMGKTPVNDSAHNPIIQPWFRGTDSVKRVMHVDIGYSGEGDALGLAMGHVAEIVEIDGEEKPLIVFDLLYREHAPKGTQILLSNIRKLIYIIKREYGFNLTHVTTDSFQSTDFQQQLRKNKFNVQEISVDRKKMPYEDLRDAIYDQRALFPHYMTVLQKGDTDLIDIPYRELSQLEDVGQKIDHPPNGSKDVADCMAGVVHHIMNDSQFRRGVMRAQRRDESNYMTVTPEIQNFITGGTADQHGTDFQPVSFENFQLNPDKHMQDMENVTVPWGVEAEHPW